MTFLTTASRALLLALAMLLLVPTAWAGGLVVDMLDVGQGDAVLIRTADKTVLIDAGIKKARVVDQLKGLGVTGLDLVVATHPHADHVGGMAEVLLAFPVKLYLDNGLPHTTKVYQELMTTVEEHEVAYRSAKRGMRLKLGDEAVLEVLFPDEKPLRNTRSDLNSNSVVLLLEHGEVRGLFTGDSEQPTEAALVAGGLGRLDLLKVAHHGSEHSSTVPFLKATRPKIALISCGADNRYGHPDPEALSRLQRSGALVFRTDLSGQVRVISDGKELEVLEGTLAELASMRLPWVPAPPTRKVRGTR